MNADEFRFPGNITGIKLKLKTDPDETAPKRIVELTIQASEDKLVQGDIPLGENGVQYAMGKLTALSTSELWFNLAVRQIPLKFGEPPAEPPGLADIPGASTPAPGRSPRKPRGKRVQRGALA